MQPCSRATNAAPSARAVAIDSWEPQTVDPGLYKLSTAGMRPVLEACLLWFSADVPSLATSPAGQTYFQLIMPNFTGAA